MNTIEAPVVSCMRQNSQHALPSNSNDMKNLRQQTCTDSPHGLSTTQNKEVKSVGIDEENLSKASINTPTKIPSISHRPSLSKITSAEKFSATPFTLIKPNSWLSSLSSKFTSSPNGSQTLHTSSAPSISVENTESAASTCSNSHLIPRQAVLPHAQKPTGDEPYVPALPRTNHPKFLQNAFRRISNSSNLGSRTQVKIQQESGICERRILNIDKNRERCHIDGLNLSKLRRVSFRVDLKLENGSKSHSGVIKGDKAIKKGKKGREKYPNRPRKDDNKNEAVKPVEECVSPENQPEVVYLPTARKITKKREKKKRYEEERKAKKEKERKLAEAHGGSLVEAIMSSSETSLKDSTVVIKPQKSLTTDPLRIYKKCCQLRETPLFKRIVEQLADSKNYCRNPVVISKLDLSGICLEMPDLMTLADYLAVVPVNELIMENCGLTSEYVRIILAGLLATQLPNPESGLPTKRKDSAAPQRGFITRIVLKNNPNIGKDGWQYISTFIAMCRSLKSIDLSKIPLHQVSATSKSLDTAEVDQDIIGVEVSCLLGKALSGRLQCKELKLLNMAECGLKSHQIGNVIDGIITTGLCRLGMAGNDVSPAGLQHIARYLGKGKCESLDLGGNDLRDQLSVIADVLTEENKLHSLSLASCNLSLESLKCLFPALVKLKKLKFIDLSNNPLLFGSEPSALSLFRRYLPQMKTLKGIKMISVSLTSEQAIALADILPELPSLAHINIMENPLRNVLQGTCNEVESRQEEACALYISLMTAVRVSKTIICVDIEVPSSESSEVVRALSKQVVAYCLWNMEHRPIAECSESDLAERRKEVAVPDVLLNLLGHAREESAGTPKLGESKVPDDNYVIGGTGILKALSICLSNLDMDNKEDIATDSNTLNGVVSLKGVRAKEMSKSLLDTARKIRAQLQTTMKKPKFGDTLSHQKLLSLDQTLEGLIKRFEDEFPETQLLPTISSSPFSISEFSQAPYNHGLLEPEMEEPETENAKTETNASDASLSEDESSLLRPVASRHNSDVSIAGRVLGEEEGQILRLSKQLKSDSSKLCRGTDDDDDDEKSSIDWPVRIEAYKEILREGLTNSKSSVGQTAVVSGTVGG